MVPAPPAPDQIRHGTPEFRRTNLALFSAGFATFAQRVTSAGILDAEDLERVDHDVRTLIDEAVTEAKAAPDPTPADVETDVYVTY